MPTLQDSLVSSSARKLPLRMRPDLSAESHRYQGQVYWVVKEPIGLNYFRFKEEEFAILQMLDGESSLDDLKDRFERQFPPQKIGVDELQHFVGMLHRSGLIVSHVPGQGVQLKKRRDERKQKELLAALQNILAIRFKGFDPERLLNWMMPYFDWVFRPWAVAAWAFTALSALLLVSVQFDVFQSKLPSFHQFFAAENWIWLALTLAVTKVIHEFGHGLSCKHFGGECHEMGVMVLVLTPCLYCNVSDSWMLPSKWHRAAIGAAGMYVEIFLASVATFLWWFSEPGLLNYLCLSTMFVCSVSTVAFNANPLLRFDGYYILSDIMEIPNLRQKATTILNRKLGAWCLGLEEPYDPFLPQRNQVLFAIYSIAAAIYRWVVVLSILWFLYKVFEPYRLEIIGQAIALGSIYGLVVQPLWKLGKFFYVPGRMDKVKRPRMYASLAIIGAVILAVVFIPLPHRVMSTVVVQPRGADPVYVSTAGTLEEVFVRPGERVEQGQRLARLSNPELDVMIAELTGRRDEYKARLNDLETNLRYRVPGAINEIPTMRTNLDAVSEQLQRRVEDRDRLEIRASSAGIVIPPPSLPEPPKEKDDKLPNWDGTPLEQKNRGALLPQGVLFCMIGKPKEMEAILVIDQADSPFVRLDQDVKVKLDMLPMETFESRIEKISNEDLKISPRQLSHKAGGELVTQTDQSGAEKPLSTSYWAQAPLEDPDGVLLSGLRGRGKIDAGWLPLGSRLWRYLTQTFNFKL